MVRMLCINLSRTAVNTLLTLYPTTAPTKRCMNLLIVITDGKDTDPGNYKDICYNNNNDGFGNNNYRYNNGYSSRYGCNLLRTNFQEIYNSVASARLTVSMTSTSSFSMHVSVRDGTFQTSQIFKVRWSLT